MRVVPTRARTTPENSRVAPVFSPSNTVWGWRGYGPGGPMWVGSLCGTFMAAVGPLFSMAGLWLQMLVQKPWWLCWSMIKLRATLPLTENTNWKREHWVTVKTYQLRERTSYKLTWILLAWCTSTDHQVHRVCVWPFTHMWAHTTVGRLVMAHYNTQVFRFRKTHNTV